MRLLTCHLFIPWSAVALLSTTAPGFAKPSQTAIALQATAPANKGRHISVLPKGGLMLGSTVITGKEVFTLVDLNEGALQDGDSVEIQYDSGKRPSYWVETPGKVTRSGDKPTATSIFKVKWKQKNKTLQLRGASGKFVSGPGKGKAVVTVGSASDNTTVFELVKNPKMVKLPSKSSKMASPKKP